MNNEHLMSLCKVSKNLYNQALYLVKKELKDNNKWVGYSYLNKELQTNKKFMQQERQPIIRYISQTEQNGSQ